MFSQYRPFICQPAFLLPPPPFVRSFRSAPCPLTRLCTPRQHHWLSNWNHGGELILIPIVLFFMTVCSKSNPQVMSMILRKCRKSNLVVPNLPKNASDDKYEGATVIEPIKAYYQKPIATLDFASLYPSIMQAYNLCYSTLVAQKDAKDLDPSTYETSPCGDIFVKSTHKKGILPEILEELLTARKRAKKDMAAATTDQERAVQNGRQLALKISANSVYGFTGATVGQLPCIPIASSTTAYGRVLLFKTKSEVEKRYTIANGYPADAQVVYGDTDSVMIKFGVDTVAETMPLAIQAAEEVTSIFPKPIKLEFEKIYMPYLLMNKKRYAGLLWTKPDKWDKIDSKGLETVRRDNCLLVRRMVTKVLHKILIERNVPDAIDYVKGTIADLLQNKVDISLLVITKSLGKSADSADYKAKQAHVELAARMKKRDPGSAPAVGDRVAYVLIQTAKGAPQYEKSEDPIYVLDNNLPIDAQYYLTNQLSNPLTRIFSPIIDNAGSLLSGDHTRVISKPTPTARKGSIMSFAVKTEKCQNCGNLLTKNQTAICSSCAPNLPDIYADKMDKARVLESQFSQLWTQCQRCQGSLHHDVLCARCVVYPALTFPNAVYDSIKFNL
jgi:DNA polymerase delta subunit 1